MAADRLAELDSALDEVLRERDFMHDMADRLAYAIAPVEVIGEHSSENCPWQNALDHVTPVAKVDEMRARIAELEEQLTKVAAFCAQRAEYVDNLRDCNADHDYYRWTGHAEARRQLSELLGLPVGWPNEDKVAAS